LTFQEAIRIAKESEGQIELDKSALNATFDYYDDNDNLHHVWYLDAATVFNQISASSRFQPYGYAFWRLGSEDPSVWKVFGSKTDASTASSMQTVDYGYDIDYEGSGEILRASEKPQSGQRELFFKPDLNIITEEKITAYPSAYTVDRWGGSDPKKIALTFDDGPDKKTTSEILDILKKYQAPATFFVTGINAYRNPGLLHRMIEEGHLIGNHTTTHPDISTLSDSEFKLELDVTQGIIESQTGRKTTLFRPPYSEDVEPETPDQMKYLVSADQLGYYTVGMHIDPQDWSGISADKIVSAVISDAENNQGNIVLLHDGGGNRTATVEALPGIIEELRLKGYKIVSVANLMGVSPAAVMPESVHKSFLFPVLSALTFFAFYLVSKLISLFFFLGIFLGIPRLLIITTLAIAQAYLSQSREKSLPKSFCPIVAVIIPAFNEEKVIVKTVNSIQASNYPDLEIIVVDDGSTDMTYQKLLDNFSSILNVRIYRKPNSGKADSLNFGVNLTDAEIIVMLDADTMFFPDTIQKLVSHFHDPRVGAVAGNAKVGNRINLLTNWQALEYITSQNMDRRSFDLINAITVVPGAVGAWRKSAIDKSGGFSNDTLTEDADLTFSVIRSGYKIVYEEKALAFTEAPDNIGDFLKQRFRWMYGMLQTAWKHKDTALHPRYGSLGFVSVPNILVFQVLFSLISPFVDLSIILSVSWALWQHSHHPVDYSSAYILLKTLNYYLLFLAIDFMAVAVAFVLERNHKEWRLLFWLPIQRLIYRQLMYYVSFKVMMKVIKGRAVRWGKFERKATVRMKEA
jgi:peptidoglycan-N-acetylglucosamine deacetylase